MEIRLDATLPDDFGAAETPGANASSAAQPLKQRPGASVVRAAAEGQWLRIFSSLAPELNDAAVTVGSTKHHLCPKHGGEHGDAFRLYPDAAKTGGGTCNTCGAFSDGFTLLCWLWGGCDFEIAVTAVADYLGVTADTKKKRGRPPKLKVVSADSPPSSPSPSSHPAKRVDAAVIAGRRAKLSRRLQESIPDDGRIAAYLHARGLSVEVPPSLKLVPLLDYFNDQKERVGSWPAIVAQMTHPSLGIVALHRTWINPETGTKAPVKPAKKFTAAIYDGAISGAAIRLYPVAADSDGRKVLAVAEGIETALSVHQAKGIPVWAAGNSGLLGSLEIPPDIDCVEIWCDNDPAQPDGKRAGQDAAAKLAERLSQHGIEVVIVTPPIEGQDWLDVLRANGADALIAARAAAEPIQPTGQRELPKIVVRTKTHEVVNEAIGALASDQKVFQRGGYLVHVIRDSAKNKKKIVRPANSPRIAPLSEATLHERLTASADWIKWVATKDGPTERPAYPPAPVIQALHKRGEWQEIRHLEAVVETPVLCPDGSILCEPGYHDETGLLFEPSQEFPQIPDKPTKDDAIEAVSRLLSLIIDFPLASEAYRAAWIAAVLTPFARHAFSGPSPLFLVDANIRGSGKSLLCDLIGLILNGKNMARMTNTYEDEMAKRITSIAIAGDPTVLIDNVADNLGCPSLDAALTATSWTGRVLGKSEKIPSMPLLTVWYATGNNIILRGDTARRVLHVKMNCQDENPEERDDFKHPHIVKHTAENRAEYVAAAVTILAGYFAAGRPSQGLKPWGSFEGWSEVVRNAVVWAGLEDPASTRKELAASADSEGSALAQLLAGWEQIDPFNYGISTTDILRKLDEPISNLGGDPYGIIRNALEEICSNSKGKSFSAKSVGMRLTRMQRRVVDGKYLVSKISVHKSHLWFVESLESSAGTTGTTGTNPAPSREKLLNSKENNENNKENIDCRAGANGIVPVLPVVPAHSNGTHQSAINFPDLPAGHIQVEV